PMNTLIVDDEKPARDELAFLLKSFPEVSVVGQGKNGLEAVSLIKEHNPDLVFLDVQMPGLDGFGVIQRLMDRSLRRPRIVFASIEDGTITICTRELEGTSNYRTIEELAETLDPERFWRPHRSHLVNINHIKEVLPWFKSSYMLKMADKRQSEVPVSRAQTK